MWEKTHLFWSIHCVVVCTYSNMIWDNYIINLGNDLEICTCGLLECNGKLRQGLEGNCCILGDKSDNTWQHLVYPECYYFSGFCLICDGIRYYGFVINDMYKGILNCQVTDSVYTYAHYLQLIDKSLRSMSKTISYIQTLYFQDVYMYLVVVHIWLSLPIKYICECSIHIYDFKLTMKPTLLLSE